MNKNKTPMVLDVDKAHFTADGMEGFWWPVEQALLHKIRDELLFLLRAECVAKKGGSPDDKEFSSALGVVYIEIVRETLVILRSYLLQQQSKAGDFDLKYSPNYLYLDAFNHNNSIVNVVHKRFHYLRYNHGSAPAWKRILRRLKFFFENNFSNKPYKRRSLRFYNKNETLILANSPFMLGHMEREGGKSFSLCSLWEWYDIPLSEVPFLNEMRDKTDDLADDLSSRICLFLEGLDIQVSDNLRHGIFEIVHLQIKYASFYRKHLSSIYEKGKLPENIWFGSTNSFYVRLLRAFIQEKGGKTTGHDHGRGFGMGINYGELGTIFDFCDEFVTYSDFMAKELDSFSGEITNRSLNNSIKFSGQGGIIVTPEAIDNYKARLKPSEAPNKKKTALIMMPVMIKEHIAGLNVLPPDHVFCDFYARLIMHFNDLDYHVIMKRHPEIKLIPNESLFHGVNVECVGGFVEDMLHDVNLLVFDFLSSAFKTQIMTDKAMMFLDFGYTKMARDTRELFEERVSVIPCEFDSENRAQFDEDLLEPAVQNAQNIKNDTKFRDIVFGVKD